MSQARLMNGNLMYLIGSYGSSAVAIMEEGRELGSLETCESFYI
jgi:hypothetical protein